MGLTVAQLGCDQECGTGHRAHSSSVGISRMSQRRSNCPQHICDTVGREHVGSVVFAAPVSLCRGAEEEDELTSCALSRAATRAWAYFDQKVQISRGRKYRSSVRTIIIIIIIITIITCYMQ